MTSFKISGIFLTFISLAFVITTDADPLPQSGGGYSSGGHSSGGLNFNKMIFTVQDARKMVANKMKNLKNFGGGSGRKHPPPKKHKPKGHDSHSGGGYGSDHHAHGSEKGNFYVSDPYGHINDYGREQKYHLQSVPNSVDQKQVGWIPIVQYGNVSPGKDVSKPAFALKQFTDKTETHLNPPDTEEAQSSSELDDVQAMQRDRPTIRYFYEPKPYRKIYAKVQHPTS